ncbi:MAG: hypothetical protein ACK4KW_03390 [Gemmobacter sp.]
MPNDFASYATNLTAPARDAAPISPSDSVPLSEPARAVYVGQAGTLRVQLVSGAEVVLANVQAGMIYPLRVARVFATGTNAGGLVALR